MKCNRCRVISSSRVWGCSCGMPWVKCVRHRPSFKYRRNIACSKTVRQRGLKRTFGEMNPPPKIEGPVYGISTYSKSKRAKVSVERPAMPASKRIKLAPGSKLALKFLHLAQDDCTTKGAFIGAGTPGATNACRVSPGLLSTYR